jgi:hypothetical protein
VQGEHSPVVDDVGVVVGVISPPLDFEGESKPAFVALLIDDKVLSLIKTPNALLITASVLWKRLFRILVCCSWKDRTVAILGVPELGKVKVMVSILLNVHYGNCIITVEGTPL